MDVRNKMERDVVVLCRYNGNILRVPVGAKSVAKSLVELKQKTEIVAIGNAVDNFATVFLNNERAITYESTISRKYHEIVITKGTVSINQCPDLLTCRTFLCIL